MHAVNEHHRDAQRLFTDEYAPARLILFLLINFDAAVVNAVWWQRVKTDSPTVQPSGHNMYVWSAMMTLVVQLVDAVLIALLLAVYMRGFPPCCNVRSIHVRLAIVVQCVMTDIACLSFVAERIRQHILHPTDDYDIFAVPIEMVVLFWINFGFFVAALIIDLVAFVKYAIAAVTPALESRIALLRAVDVENDTAVDNRIALLRSVRGG